MSGTVRLTSQLRHAHVRGADGKVFSVLQQKVHVDGSLGTAHGGLVDVWINVPFETETPQEERMRKRVEEGIADGSFAVYKPPLAY